MEAYARVFAALDAALQEMMGHGVWYFMQRSRKREIVEVRFMIFALLHEFSRLPDVGWARFFRFHHVTTMNARNRAQMLREVDKEYDRMYQALAEKMADALK